MKKSIDEIHKGKPRIDRRKIASLTNAQRERIKRDEGIEDADFGPPRVVVPKVDLRALRERLGLSQEEFATRYLLPPRTVQEWEQNRREPSEPARVLLFAISRDPRAIEKALHKK